MSILKVEQGVAALVAALCCAGAVAQTETIVETFDDRSTNGDWAWGTGNEFVSELNGNPGPYMRDDRLFSFIPLANSGFGVRSDFSGDYRARGVISVGIDLITLDASLSIGGRPLTLMLINDNRTPSDLTDDFGAYFIGDKTLPSAGATVRSGPAGWTSFDFEVPSSSDELPEGWGSFTAKQGLAGVIDWNKLITDVDVLGFSYGRPDEFFLLTSWKVGMDNPRITMEASAGCDADFNGDGMVDVFDVLGFITALRNGDAAADLDGDGEVDFFDFSLFIRSFAQCKSR